MQKKYRMFKSTWGTLCVCLFLFISYGVLGQQNVFHRDNANTGDWGSGNLPWFYSSSNNSQGDPDNGNTTRNDVFIGHNNNLTMSLNGRYYLHRDFTFEAGASSARTLNNTLGGGFSFSRSLINASIADNIFNSPIGIDGNNAEIRLDNSSGGSLTFNGDVFTNNNQVFIRHNNNNSGNITFNGAMSQGGSFIKQGLGTLVFTGNANFSGSIFIDEGRVRVNRDFSLNVIDIGGGVQGTTGFNANLEVSSAVTISKNISVRNFGTGSGDRSITFSHTTGSALISGTLALEKLVTIEITNSSPTASITGLISGNGSITKTGLGILTLTGANTYTGLTTINAGTLQLNRSGGNTIPTTNDIIVSGGTLRVSSSQTLKDLTINSGGLTVDSGQTLTIDGILTVDAGASLNITGNLAFGPSSRLVISGSSNFETNNGIFPTTSGPVNFEINHSGTVTLHATRSLSGEVKVTQGTLVINPIDNSGTNEGVGLTAASLDNDGSVVIGSVRDAYSSLIVDNITGSGTVTYNRHVNDFDAGDAANSNDLVSPPTAITDVNAFLTGNSNLLSQGTEPTVYAFAPFNNNTGVYENLDSNDTGALIADTGTPLFTRGTGFRAATSGPNQTLQFTGTVATTPVDVTITVGSATNGTEAWNLIGNPFPSYLDFAAFFNDNSTEFDTNAQAVYGYNATTSRWTIWNQATIDDLSETEYIAPGQGFFVKSKTGGGTVSFTPAMRTTLGSDDFIAGRSANSVSVARADINLETDGKDFNTIIYFNSNATSNLDPGYDAAAYLGNASGIFTHLAEGNTGVELAIQSLAYNDFNEVTIPLGIKSNGGQAMTISLGTNNTLPESVNVYLEDTANGTFTLLNNNSYTVTPESALNGTGRFFLRFTSGTLTTGDEMTNSLNIYQDSSAQVLVIEGQLQENTAAYIYDLQGRLVQSTWLEAVQLQHNLKVSSLQTGIYIVKIGQQITHKVMIR